MVIKAPIADKDTEKGTPKSTVKRTDRARSDQDKQARKRVILQTALNLWQHIDYASITMSQVAAQASLAKGTLYLYFPTKEELFLALLDDLLLDWFAEVNRALEGIEGTVQVAQALIQSLKNREEMVRLLSILSTVLEQNSSLEAARQFKLNLFQHTRLTGTLLERALDLPTGQGIRLILHFNAITIGLFQMSRPVAGISDDPQFAPLKVDFLLELEVAVRALLGG
jgi:AcrR family transcriptional regulator